MAFNRSAASAAAVRMRRSLVGAPARATSNAGSALSSICISPSGPISSRNLKSSSDTRAGQTEVRLGPHAQAVQDAKGEVVRHALLARDAGGKTGSRPIAADRRAVAGQQLASPLRRPRKSAPGPLQRLDRCAPRLARAEADILAGQHDPREGTRRRPPCPASAMSLSRPDR